MKGGCAAMVGEPTDLAPCLSQHGYLKIQACTRGQRRHASLASAGENPIETMPHLISRISHHLASQRPEIVYNIRDLFAS